ncbi:MAG: hypothetical protein KY410_03870, partial [Proteobacteria bacterium]|nr:hypothetical protein [Pseudomonadota bacterium]
MNFSSSRRLGIYSFGGFCLLVLTVLLLQGLFSSPKTGLEASSGPECLSSVFSVDVSDDGYLEGGVATNCETGADVLLS